MILELGKSASSKTDLIEEFEPAYKSLNSALQKSSYCSGRSMQEIEEQVIGELFAYFYALAKPEDSYHGLSEISIWRSGKKVKEDFAEILVKWIPFVEPSVREEIAHEFATFYDKVVFEMRNTFIKKTSVIFYAKIKNKIIF